MAKQKYQTNKEKIQKRLQIFFYSRHFHKINVKTYNHQVRINYHTWEVKEKLKTRVKYIDICYVNKNWYLKHK